MSLLEKNWKIEKSRKLKKNHPLFHHPEKTTYKHFGVLSSNIRPPTHPPTPPPRLLFLHKARGWGTVEEGGLESGW